MLRPATEKGYSDCLLELCGSPSLSGSRGCFSWKLTVACVLGIKPNLFTICWCLNRCFWECAKIKILIHHEHQWWKIKIVIQVISESHSQFYSRKGAREQQGFRRHLHCRCHDVAKSNKMNIVLLL